MVEPRKETSHLDEFWRGKKKKAQEYHATGIAVKTELPSDRASDRASFLIENMHLFATWLLPFVELDEVKLFFNLALSIWKVFTLSVCSNFSAKVNLLLYLWSDLQRSDTCHSHWKTVGVAGAAQLHKTGRWPNHTLDVLVNIFNTLSSNLFSCFCVTLENAFGFDASLITWFFFPQ